MSFIYLASPYTHENQTVMQERYELALSATYQLIQQGFIVYSPIVHFHDLAQKFALPKDAVFWSKQNTGMLSRAALFVIAMLDGWENSKGVTAEREQATRMGLHISLFNPQTKQWEA